MLSFNMCYNNGHTVNIEYYMVVYYIQLQVLAINGVFICSVKSYNVSVQMECNIFKSN